MGMTQAQLLASLGARSITSDNRGVVYAVEKAGVRITGEVFLSSQTDSILAQITYQDGTMATAHRACGLRADPVDGLYSVQHFMVSDIAYIDGEWRCFFNEDGACGFVRAVMLELEAGRLPDLDELLSVATMASGTTISIDWR